MRASEWDKTVAFSSTGRLIIRFLLKGRIMTLALCLYGSHSCAGKILLVWKWVIVFINVFLQQVYLQSMWFAILDDLDLVGLSEYTMLYLLVCKEFSYNIRFPFYTFLSSLEGTLGSQSLRNLQQILLYLFFFTLLI